MCVLYIVHIKISDRYDQNVLYLKSFGKKEVTQVVWFYCIGSAEGFNAICRVCFNGM